jgi:succinoglycan biosynthesis transport protein ExoP
MENDQRLTPLPVVADLQPAHIDFSPGYASSYDDTLQSKRSIRQYINVVYKRLPIIIALTVLVTAATAFYSYRLPPEYMAVTSLIIEPRSRPVTQKDAININFGDDEKYYKTQLRLLQNQDLMRRVVLALGLQRDPNLFGEENRGFLSGIKSLFSGGQKPLESDTATLPVISDNSQELGKNDQIQLTPEESKRADIYAAKLAGGLTVEQVERTNLVNVKVQASRGDIAAKVADKVAELFRDEDQKRETQGAEKAYEELRASIEDLKATIINQDNEYLAALRRAGLPLQEKGGELRAGNLEALMTQYRDAQNETGKIQALYTATVNASGKGDILALVGDNKAIQDARSNNLKRQADLEKLIEDIDKKINDANEKKQALLVKYTPEYRDVKAEVARIEELTAQKERVRREVTTKIETEGQNLIKNAEKEVLASLRSQLAAAQQREARQRDAFERAAARANVEGQYETELTRLKRETESNRLLLDTYMQRQKEQELALSTGRPTNIKIQANAVTPTVPTGPQRNRNILVALLLSLGAGIGLAFLLDYLDDSVRTSDDISRHLGLPTLALIPHYINSEKKKLLTAKNGAAPTGSSASSALITLDERHSPVAEAYRHLRTSLLFSSAGKPPQTILVTSSQPSEGKTTTAINIAITLAQSDAEVVVVDCDLRRPRLHSHFNLENSRGLTNYLSGDKDTTGLIRTYADLPKLKVITSGPIPPNPAELLSSNEMRNLLQFLTGKFKHVIIDSPPAISFTDATILSTLVDGVVLVAMANKSSIHLMRQFKQRVGNIGARIYGVVLNGIKANSTEYYYYGSGYYKYYSQAQDDESTPMLEDVRTDRD